MHFYDAPAQARAVLCIFTMLQPRPKLEVASRASPRVLRLLPFIHKNETVESPHVHEHAFLRCFSLDSPEPRKNACSIPDGPGLGWSIVKMHAPALAWAEAS